MTLFSSDYTWQRLVIDENTKQLGNWIKENTEPLKDLPRYLIPCYFDVILVTIYLLLIEKVFQLMSEYVFTIYFILIVPIEIILVLSGMVHRL